MSSKIIDVLSSFGKLSCSRGYFCKNFHLENNSNLFPRKTMLAPFEFTWPFRWFCGWITGYMVVLLIIQLFSIQDLVTKYAIKLLYAVKVPLFYADFDLKFKILPSQNISLKFHV